jgi:VWFA-related protein
MSRRPVALVVALVAWGGVRDTTAISTGPQADQARPPTFRARAEAVSVDVAVRRNGRPVTGLTATDFEILDNGVPQTIADFSDGARPIDVRVAFDVSASVTAPLLAELRRAMSRLQQDLHPRDRLQILTFSSRIRRVADAGRDTNLDDVFATIRPSGSTAVFDALAVALATPVVPDRRYLVVAFTDGLDTNSVTQPAALLDLVRRTTPTLHVVLPADVRYAMVVFRPEVDRTPGQQDFTRPTVERQRVDLSQAARAFRQVYAQLARETGGLAVAITPHGDLPTSFTQALQEFRDSYVLHFVPTGVEDAGVHQLTIRVKREDVDVRARKSYVRK